MYCVPLIAWPLARNAKDQARAVLHHAGRYVVAHGAKRGLLQRLGFLHFQRVSHQLQHGHQLGVGGFGHGVRGSVDTTSLSYAN